MLAKDIKVGGKYIAKVGVNITTVRVDAIRKRDGFKRTETVYDVTNLKTGRKTTFRSASKFRGPEVCYTCKRGEDEQRSDPMVGSAGPTASLVNETPTHGDSRLTDMLRQAQATNAATKRSGPAPTEEQVAIIEAAVRLQWARRHGEQAVLVVQAGAGAGKTATDIMLEQELVGSGQYTCFSRSLTDEARTKFKRARVTSTYGLAFSQVGKLFKNRLDNNRRQRASEVAAMLGIEQMILTTDEKDKDGKAIVKTLTAKFLAFRCLEAVKRFCQSADREITTRHFGYIDGIDAPQASGKRGHKLNDQVKIHLLPFAKLAWKDLCDLKGGLKFGHDCYFKMWQLGLYGEPIIPADYILLDEAQDSDPVLIDVLKRQKALLVIVGDDAQQIFEWRGAVNAMSGFAASPGAETLYLSQSFRFGQAIADVANAVLGSFRESECKLRLKGLRSIQSKVCKIDRPRCILTRTNAGAIAVVLRAFDAGLRPHLIGGGADVCRFIEAATDLQGGRTTDHPDLATFTSWKEVQKFVEEDEGSDLKLLVDLVDKFGAAKILRALKNMPLEELADIVVCTAHKSKGRQWESVKLHSDFPVHSKNSESGAEVKGRIADDAERRLIYVACTRAQLGLDITECPFFHSEYGLQVTFTPVSYEAAEPTPVAVAEPVQTPEPAGAHTVRNNNSGVFTWARGRNNDWLVRGPASIAKLVEEGDEPVFVEVVKKSGQKSKERLTKVVWKDATIGLYKVS